MFARAFHASPVDWAVNCAELGQLKSALAQSEIHYMGLNLAQAGTQSDTVSPNLA